MRERSSVIGYTNHVMSLEVLAQKSKIQSDRFHQMVPCGGDIKSSQKDNPKIPDIFFGALLSPSKSTFIHREDCILLLIVSRVD